MTAPLNTSRAWVSNKPKLVILTPTAAKAVSLRELCFSNETRVVPSINGNNIIIGSTLVSIVVNRSKPIGESHLSRITGLQRAAQESQS